METALKEKPETSEGFEELFEEDYPDLDLVEEIRDPKPLEAGSCWCPGIGQEVVTVSTFPIALGKC